MPDQAVGLSQRPSDRVVLAREPSDDEVDIGDGREGRSPTDRVHLGLELIEDRRDVLVHGFVRRQAEDVPGCSDTALASAVGLEVAAANVADVAVERVLRLCRRLPLVAPHDVETGAIECEMEAPDPGEELGGGRSATGLTTGVEVGIGHAESFETAAVVGRAECSRSCAMGSRSALPMTARLSQASEITPKSCSPVDWKKPPPSSVIDTSSRFGQFGS